VSIFRRFKDTAVSTSAEKADFKSGSFIEQLPNAPDDVNTSEMIEKNIISESRFIAKLYSFGYQWL
jgi:hypothetical protein